ncbi:M1 family aminopeptidase [Kosmotoga pacifica]|uniref:Peptidase M1 membrane alanine aminopeptidase domain-containing protein n=1 Tax=Kosmotoga pacifica TaxID=1330330 RepID=A0A0G2ZFI6_9BACT|nr:M1 family aminopeptidase [Kosmotoga pacifica]AKI97528.1 hypothetical protein IX53_06530 [Kosmotoga pacifica]
MKSICVVFLFFVTAAVFAVNFNIQARFNPEELIISGTLSTKDDIKNYLLLPNYASEGNPYLHALFEEKGGKIDIISVTDGSGRMLNYELITYPATLLGDESLRQRTMLTIKENVEQVVISFRTHLKKKRLPEEGTYSDFVLYRFGWYPLPVEDLEGLRISPHSWQLMLQVPEGWEGVVGGERESETVWKSNGNYLSCPLALVKKESYKELSFSGDEVKVVVHFRKGFEGTASKLAAYALQVLDNHIRKLGPLRYSTVHIMQDPFPGLYGITADGLVAIGDGFFTTADLWVSGFLDPLAFYLVAHELSHLWFGIGTSVDFLKNNFMSESISDYIAHSTMLEIYGNDYYMNWDSADILVTFIKDYFDIPLTVSQADQFMLLYAKMAGVKAAVADATDRIPQNFSSAIYYQKGKRAFFSLEEIVGREKLYSILSEYYRHYVGKNVFTDEFLSFIGRYIDSGILEALFLERENFDARVYLEDGKIKIDNGSMKVPLRVIVESSDGSSSFVTTESTSLTYFPGMKVHLDPGMHTFDIERHNNHWPPLIEGEYGKDQNRYDAYLLSTHLNIELSASGIGYTGELLFEKFPYFGFGILSQSGYLSKEGIGYNYSGALFYFRPDNYTFLKGRYSELEGIHLFAEISIPEKLFIGDSAPLLISRHKFSVEGRYLDSENFYIDGVYSFNNMLKHGLYVGMEGLVGGFDAVPTYLGGFFGTLITDIESGLLTVFDVFAAVEASGKEVLDPFYDVLSVVATSNSLDPMMSKYPATSYLLDFKFSLPYTFSMDKRINFLNLFSLGGMGTSWEFDCRIFNGGVVFGTSVILSPVIYIIGDTPIRLYFGLSLLMDAEGESTLAIKGSVSLGSSIYFNENIVSTIKEAIKWKSSGSR